MKNVVAKNMTADTITQNSKLKTQNFFVLVLYAIITVVMTWPLVADLSGKVLRGRVDEYMFMWGFWWMKHSMVDLHQWPFHTDMLYYPFGTELAFHTWSPLLGLLSIPVQLLWGTEVAFNLAIFCGYLFSAFAMYLLADYLVRDKRAAFVAGLVFAFSVFKFYQTTGHIHVISTEFLPIFLLLFIKLLRETDHRRRYAIFAGISLGLIFLIDYYQTVYAMFFALCYLLYYLFGRLPQTVTEANTDAGEPSLAPTDEGTSEVLSSETSEPTLVTSETSPLKPQTSNLSTLHIVAPALANSALSTQHAALPRRRLADRRTLLSTLGLLLILGAVFITVGSPLLVADYTAIKNGYYVKWPGENEYFADALAFVTPANPLLSGWQPNSERNWWATMGYWDGHPESRTNLVQQAISTFYNGTESWVFIGWLVLAIVIVTGVRMWRSGEVRFWLVFTVISFLFALGPTPHFAGNTIPLPGDPAFWQQFPFVHSDTAGNPQMPGLYAIWAAIPFLNNARVPARFDMLVTLGCGLLVAYGLAAFFAWIPGKFPRLRPALLTAALAVLISFVVLFESFVLPFLADGGHVLGEPRATYAMMAAEPNDYTVLNIPQQSGIVPTANYEHTMYEQSLHHKPVMFAGISRPLLTFKPYFLRERYVNILTQFADTLQPMEDGLQAAMNDPAAMQFYREEGARLTYYLNIGYLVVHPTALAPSAVRFIEATLPVEQLYAPPPASADDTIVYRLRRDELPTSALVSDVQMGDDSSAVFRMSGFGRIEVDPNKNPVGYTWMTSTTALMLTPVREPADYTVSFTTRPMLPPNGQPQTLSVYLNDDAQLLATFTLATDDWQTNSVNIPAARWKSATNKLTLKASYLAPPSPSDTRTRAIAFKSVKFDKK